MRETKASEFAVPLPGPGATDAEKHPTTENDFDPYDCGQADGLGACGAAILVVKGCIGASFLLIPHIMKSLGYVTGTLVVVLTGVAYFHTIHTLLAVEYSLCKRLKLTSLSYVQLADSVFAAAPPPFRRLRVLVRRTMCVFYSLPTSNASYLILIANGARLLGAYFDRRLEPTRAITAAIVPLALCCMSRRILRILVPFASATNVCSFGMAAVLAAASTLRRRFSVSWRPFGDWRALPECVAKCVKAYCCTGIILPVKNDMRRPRKMAAALGSLNAAASAVVAFYYAFGAILYANYGDDVRENVLLNLPAGDPFGDAVTLLYTATLLVSYVLAFYSRFDNVWSGGLRQSVAGTRYEVVVEYGVRVGINVLAYVLAVAVPNLALISAVAGTLTIVVEVALPSVLRLLCSLADGGTKVRERVQNVGVLAVCLGLFCMSSNACVRQIIAMYST